MVKFDKELFAQRYMELKPRFSREIVDVVMENAEKNMDERLQPILDAYLKDKTIINFQFEDVCIEEIMEKYTFFDSLVKMSMFLKNPEDIKIFRKYKNDPLE